MSCEEDSSLLFLIVQHLKMKGLLVAAQVLEEHVSQVDIPNTSLNLQDIYKGWMKLCSHKQHGEQPADESDAPCKVEPEGGADERPSKDKNMDVEALLASKTEDVERSNGREHNGCRSPPPEKEEQTQQEQPEVVMDPPLELSVSQTEATPLPTEATNDCSGDGGNTEWQENENGLKEHQEMFSASDVPPLADADVMTEPDKEVAEMEVSVTAQSEQEDNQMGALESPDEDKMAAEQRDHLDVAITLNIDSGKTDVPLDEEVATPKKKKKKKTAVEDDQETEQANPLQNMKIGKKRKKEEKDHQEVEDDVAAPEEKKKRKKRRRKKEEEEEGEGLGTEEVPCDEGVTGVGADLQEKLKEQDSATSQLSSAQKRRRRRRLRVKKHARMQKQPDASEEHQTLSPEPFKRDMGDVTLEEGAPHERMMKTQEETSSKENQSSTSITKKDKKKKKTAASEEKVDDACNFLEAVSQKKKKKRAANEEAVQDMGNDWNAKDLLEVKRRKKNKKREKEEEDEEEEDAQSRETPVCSDSSANKKKKKKVKGKTMDDEDI
ncbi:ABC transporter F family member 4-like isoform X2 [Hippocampus comes]|uniref:ABC transporter F family member 4-like isoform X2 n=1 Tax=Hippocampus comes TaxID=109280 RepID=UPI00094E20B1|nr:PREDICTED: ABC transporter F family member 4-like isoform X2 [Hippocampus comes]XP_019748482.1 PREDICTED: ABC transporter F family member 4-like isoform X2 [Hippocampus comes]